MHPLQNLEDELRLDRELSRSKHYWIFAYDGRYLAFVSSTIQSDYRTCLEYSARFNFLDMTFIDTENAGGEGFMVNNMNARALHLFSMLKLPYYPIIVRIKLNTLIKLIDKYCYPNSLTSDYNGNLIPASEVEKYSLPIYKQFFNEVKRTMGESFEKATELLEMWLPKNEVDSIVNLGYVDIKSKIYPNRIYRLFVEGATKIISNYPMMKNHYEIICVEANCPESINLYDQLLSKIAELKTDEKNFLKVANLL